MVTQEQIDAVNKGFAAGKSADQIKGEVIALDPNSNVSKKKKKKSSNNNNSNSQSKPSTELTIDTMGNVLTQQDLDRIAADKAIREGKATAGDILGRGAVDNTPENLDALRQRVAANEYNKKLNEQNAAEEARQNKKNTKIIEAQKKAGLNNAEIINYNVLGQLPEDKTPSDINPNTGRPYGTYTENKPSFSEKYNRAIEESQQSNSALKKIGGAYVDVAVSGTKTLAYDLPVGLYNLVVHPVDTAKSTYSLFFDTEQRTKAAAELSDTIKNRPGVFVGVAAANLLAPKVFTKVLKKGVGFIEESAKVSKAVLRSKKAAVFRGSTSSKAGQRVSPMSNTQKSKQARNQYYDPKETMQPNKIIQRSGRANVDTRVIERIEPGIVRSTVTKKTPRSANRVTARGTTDINLVTQTQNKNILTEVTIGQGKARTPRQGIGSRPASQVSNNKSNLQNAPLSDNEYVLVKRQVQKIDNAQYTKRVERPAEQAVFNNPGNNQAIQTQKKFKTKSAPQNTQYVKRVANPRDRIFKQTKARLKKVAQKRLADKRGTYENTYIPESFFNDGTSKALAKVSKSKSISKTQSAGEIGIKTNAKNLPATVSSSELSKYNKGKYVFTNVEERAPGLGSDTEIIRPKQYPKAKSVSKPKPAAVQKNLPGVLTRALVRTSQAGQIKSKSGQSLDTLRDSKFNSISNSKSKSDQYLKDIKVLDTSSKSDFDIRQSLGSKTSSSQRQGQSQRQIPAVIQTRVQKSQITPVQITNIEPTTQTSKRGKPKDPNPFKPVKPVDPNPNIPREPNRPRPPKPRKPTEPKEPPKIPKLKFFPKSSTNNRYEVFNVLTRKKGKPVKASNQPLSKSQALLFGSDLVNKTARASFKLTSAGFRTGTNSVSSKSSLSNFKPGKGGWLVEKNKYRINTPDEKKEIRRKSSFFSAANIKRKVKGSFWS